MCLVPLIWASFLGEESSKVSFTCFSKFCEQLYEIPTQRGDSIPSSKISWLSLLSDVFKLLSLSCLLRGDSIPSSKISGLSLLSDVFKLLSLSLLPSFFHRLRLVYHLNHVFVYQKIFDSSTHIQNRFKMQK